MDQKGIGALIGALLGGYVKDDKNARKSAGARARDAMLGAAAGGYLGEMLKGRSGGGGSQAFKVPMQSGPEENSLYELRGVKRGWNQAIRSMVAFALVYENEISELVEGSLELGPEFNRRFVQKKSEFAKVLTDQIRKAAQQDLELLSMFPVTRDLANFVENDAEQMLQITEVTVSTFCDPERA
jgi:hypothetical protein